MTNQPPTFLTIPRSDLPASSSLSSLHLCWLSGKVHALQCAIWWRQGGASQAASSLVRLPHSECPGRVGQQHQEFFLQEEGKAIGELGYITTSPAHSLCCIRASFSSWPSRSTPVAQGEHSNSQHRAHLLREMRPQWASGSGDLQDGLCTQPKIRTPLFELGDGFWNKTGGLCLWKRKWITVSLQWMG